MRNLEVIYKDITRAKLTIAKDRVTFKFPLRMSDKINLLVLGAIFRYCDETPCEENTMRGRFNEESTSVYMEYDNGAHATTIPIHNLFIKELTR